ncbi:ATP-grasp domain-containing protein [Candidatus Kaiserbacteria bacterium]|nr:ATP-grasp domain-containing protein [Candidatus Kaiserbacteria bacterium]MCB9812012.1 ATP-grasp domain-containing protein [Candidatus Nomurabacteria bacterium]
MKFGFIAGKPQKSFECLAKRAALRGHEVEHIPLADMPLSLSGVTAFVNSCAANYDALHYYAGLADPIGIAFGQVCDDLGIPLLNNRSRVPHLTHNKMFQTLSFSRAGLPIPATEFTRSPDWETLSSKLGNPVVAKRVRGTHGDHVHIIRSQEDLSVVEGPSDYLFQEYLPHRNDVRVLVLEGNAICGYRRVPAEGDFRANLARGGYAEPLADDGEKDTVFRLAEAAVTAMPHDLAGVDIIKSETDGQYRLIEINTNPSWYGIAESANTQFEDILLDTYEALAAKR